MESGEWSQIAQASEISNRVSCWCCAHGTSPRNRSDGHKEWAPGQSVDSLAKSDNSRLRKSIETGGVV